MPWFSFSGFVVFRLSHRPADFLFVRQLVCLPDNDKVEIED